MQKNMLALCGLQTLLVQMKNYLDVKTNKRKTKRKKKSQTFQDQTGKMKTERDLEETQWKVHTTKKEFSGII